MDTNERKRPGGQRRPAGKKPGTRRPGEKHTPRRPAEEQRTTAERKRPEQSRPAPDRTRERPAPGAEHKRPPRTPESERTEARRPAPRQEKTTRQPEASELKARSGISSRSGRKKSNILARAAFASASAVEGFFQRQTGTQRINSHDSVRRRSARRAEKRQKETEKNRKAPSVTYTQPKPFQLNRFLLQICTMAAVVLALTVGLSIFFKVDKVVVHGANSYTAWAVKEASGVSEGANLMTFSKARACAKIRKALPYVDQVRIGINLPDTVNIYIKELDVVYAIKGSDGFWWLMAADGRIIEQTDAGDAGIKTRILGVELESPIPGEPARAVEAPLEGEDGTAPTVTIDETQVTVPPLATGKQKLDAVLTILQGLESNDVIGSVATIDVSDLSSIELWYEQRFQVMLGDTSRLDYKVATMVAAINSPEMKDYSTGVLDVSFTIRPEEVMLTPFE